MATEKVAFVTGASRGIGKQAALALARRGYDVAICARTIKEGDGTNRGTPVPGSLESTAAEIEDLGQKALQIQMDLLDRESVKAAAATLLDTWGRLDVLVNNAIYQGGGSMDRFLELDLDDAEKAVRADYLHTVLLTQLLIPTLLESDAPAVVNVTSGVALNDPPGPAGAGGWGLAYAAAKAATHRMVGILMAEYRDAGLRAFNLEPGFVLTESQLANDSTRHIRDTGSFDTAPPLVPGEVIAWLASGAAGSEEWIGRTIFAQPLCRKLGLVPGWPPDPEENP